MFPKIENGNLVNPLQVIAQVSSFLFNFRYPLKPAKVRHLLLLSFFLSLLSSLHLQGIDGGLLSFVMLFFLFVIFFFLWIMPFLWSFLGKVKWYKKRFFGFFFTWRCSSIMSMNEGRSVRVGAFKCEAVAATSGVTSTLPHRIRDGLLVTLFFFQNLSFFGMPLRDQGVPRTSGAKTKQGELFVGRNPLIAY